MAALLTPFLRRLHVRQALERPGTPTIAVGGGGTSAETTMIVPSDENQALAEVKPASTNVVPRNR